MSNRVAIILINWNGLQDTLACLGSLATQTYRDCTTIVVDNHSSEDISVINVTYPDVVVIRNQDNLGFCGGNNIGINKAAELDIEYCWILNNDTEVAPDCLAHLVNALDGDPDVAAVAHPIIYYDDRRLYWFAGGVFRQGLPKHRDYMAPIANAGTDSTTTEYLTGCSFLARTRVLQKLGGFDEHYFCYVEDVDLSIRIKEQGHRLGYVPEAVVWHKVSRSAGVRSPLKLYYKSRNMLYFLNKFKRPAGLKLRWLLRSARISVVLVLKHRHPKAAWYMIRGLIHGATGRMGRIAA
ncbi:MAG: glycosyltransferase family 2 protein [Gammaproteobacteria bacterium]|nr:glycosyltransferase family 2 protein [Gammaproteobacteria bacterium]